MIFNIMGAQSTCQALYMSARISIGAMTVYILLCQDNFYGGICPHCPHGSAASVIPIIIQPMRLYLACGTYISRTAFLTMMTS